MTPQVVMASVATTATVTHRKRAYAATSAAAALLILLLLLLLLLLVVQAKPLAPSGALLRGYVVCPVEHSTRRMMPDVPGHLLARFPNSSP